MTDESKTCFELRAALEDLGLSQAQLAALCGVKRLQAWRWCEGKADVPTYVWAMLTLAKGRTTILQLVHTRRFHQWKVEKHHVYRNGKEFKGLARRFHPDVSGRDTTAEMQIINAMRKK